MNNLIIKSEGNSKPERVNEGQEKGNNRNITTPRPIVQPAPQPTQQPVQQPKQQPTKRE